MDETKKAKIVRFLDDKIMSDAVYNVIQGTFLRKRAGDTQLLAASFLAIGLLEDAWRELERSRNETNEPPRTLNQVGL